MIGREARRAFAFFPAGFTFSGLGNHFANTAAGRLFPTSRFNDVLRRALTLTLLFTVSLFVLTPLTFLQGRYIAAYQRQFTAFIQGSKLC